MVAVARELEAENYHDIKRITARKDNVIRLWEYLLELLRARRQRLEMNLGLQKIFQEMLYIMDWMDEMKVNLSAGSQSPSSQASFRPLFWGPPTHPPTATPLVSSLTSSQRRTLPPPRRLLAHELNEM